MGLDIYVERRPRSESEEVAYWRKQNALQGWFEKNYNIENCGEVILTEEVVNKLLVDLENQILEPTEGFFYGSDKPLSDEWFKDMHKEWSDILSQIKMNPGYEYYYTCWY